MKENQGSLTCLTHPRLNLGALRGNPFSFSALFALAMLWKFARPKVGAPQEFENVRLVQFGVAMWCNQLLVHLRIFGPVHVAVHVMNGMVAIVACDPVDHWTREVPSGIHIHFGTFVLSKNNVLRPVMLQHVPQ